MFIYLFYIKYPCIVLHVARKSIFSRYAYITREILSISQIESKPKRHIFLKKFSRFGTGRLRASLSSLRKTNSAHRNGRDETWKARGRRGAIAKTISPSFVCFSRHGTRGGFLESLDDPFGKRPWNRKTRNKSKTAKDRKEAE